MNGFINSPNVNEFDTPISKPSKRNSYKNDRSVSPNNLNNYDVNTNDNTPNTINLRSNNKRRSHGNAVLSLDFNNSNNNPFVDKNTISSSNNINNKKTFDKKRNSFNHTSFNSNISPNKLTKQRSSISNYSSPSKDDNKNKKRQSKSAIKFSSDVYNKKSKNKKRVKWIKNYHEIIEVKSLKKWNLKNTWGEPGSVGDKEDKSCCVIY